MFKTSKVSAIISSLDNVYSWAVNLCQKYKIRFELCLWGCQEHFRRHWFKRIVIKKYLWRKPTLEMCMVLSGWFAIIAVKYNSTTRWQVTSIYNIYVLFTGISGKSRRISKLNNLFKEFSTVVKMFITILVFRVRQCLNTYTMCRVWWHHPEKILKLIISKCFFFSPSSELKLTTHNMLWKSWDQLTIKPSNLRWLLKVLLQHIFSSHELMR